MNTIFPATKKLDAKDIYAMTSQFSEGRVAVKDMKPNMEIMLDCVIIRENADGGKTIFLRNVNDEIFVSNSSILIDSYMELYDAFGDNMFDKSMTFRFVRRRSNGGRTYNYMTVL